MNEGCYIVIYALLDPITNDLRYIGQTNKFIFSRLEEHLKEGPNKFDSKKFNWIQSLKSQGKEPELRRLFNCTSQAQSNYFEKLFIFYWKYILLQPLYNVSIAKGQDLFNLFEVYPYHTPSLQIIDQYQKGHITKFSNKKFLIS